jgi:hypothetical protein
MIPSAAAIIITAHHLKGATTNNLQGITTCKYI